MKEEKFVITNSSKAWLAGMFGIPLIILGVVIYIVHFM